MKRSRDTKPNPLPDLLTMAGDHLPYEVHMVGLTAISLALPHPSGPLHDAMVESFALHSRNALFFFDAPENVEDDDVIAEDYFARGNEWRAIRTKLTPDVSLFDKVRNQAAKQIAHLTYDRLRIKGPQDKLWQTSEIWEIVATMRNSWLSNVDVRHRDAYHAKVQQLDAAACDAWRAMGIQIPPGATIVFGRPPRQPT